MVGKLLQEASFFHPYSVPNTVLGIAQDDFLNFCIFEKLETKPSYHFLILFDILI